MTELERNILAGSAIGITAAAAYVSSVTPPIVVPLDAYATGPMYCLLGPMNNFAPVSGAKIAPVVAKIGTVGKAAAASKLVTVGGASILKGGLMVLTGGSILFGVAVIVMVAVVVYQERKKK